MIPEILIIILGAIYILSGKKIIPRPIVWGRLKFIFYFFAILNFLMNNYNVAKILFIIGVIFAYLAVVSYTKRYLWIKK